MGSASCSLCDGAIRVSEGIVRVGVYGFEVTPHASGVISTLQIGYFTRSMIGGLNGGAVYFFSLIQGMQVNVTHRWSWDQS